MLLKRFGFTSVIYLYLDKIVYTYRRNSRLVNLRAKMNQVKLKCVCRLNKFFDYIIIKFLPWCPINHFCLLIVFKQNA